MEVIILSHEDYLKAMDRLELLYCVEDINDDECSEILELSRATEDWELKNGV